MIAPVASVCAFWKSSIGKKIVVAVTGLALVGFLVGHLTGNLLVFAGPVAFNDYAKFLHELGHGAAIWVARIGLLVFFGLHVWGTISLTIENRKANIRDEQETTVQASKSSRLMIWSGLTVLAFLIFHLLQYTVRVTDDTLHALGTGNDVYAMVIAGFQNPLVTIFYVVALACLFSHLSHGVASVFQTLGLRRRKTRWLIDKGSTAFSALLFVGFSSIPVAILMFGLGDKYLQQVLKAMNLA